MSSSLVWRLITSYRAAVVNVLPVRRLTTLQNLKPLVSISTPVPWINHHGPTTMRSIPEHSQCRWTSTASQTSPSNTEVLEQVNGDIDRLQPSNVFAVVHISGRQFKITANDLIVVNRLEADIGEEIYLEKVLLAGSENFTLVGRPVLSNEIVRVKATVSEHSRTAKVIVFKKKRRKNYKRKRGHRQDVTVLRINEINLSSTLE